LPKAFAVELAPDRLRQLTFMDSTALHLMVRAQRLSLEDGFDFALIDGNEPVCRVLDITGLRDHLRFTRIDV
jgi:anti-anti-sigma factor